MSHLRIAILGLVLGLVPLSQSAIAQPLGTFRWQVQPYCNVLTLRVVQQAGIYTVDGTDDLCGSTQAASVVGIASANPSGTVGFGMTLVLPGGTPVHIEATINMSSLNGTWRDSAGNNGNFIFMRSGPGIGGDPRPVPQSGIPPASITLVQMAPNSVSGANVVDGSITTADILDGPRAEFAGGDQLFTLNGTAQIVRSVSVTAPSAGRVIVNATGYFWFVDNNVPETARCTVTTGNAIEGAYLILAGETASAAVQFQPFAGTRVFSVAAGTHTYNLVCDRTAGVAVVGDSQVSALFVANPPTP